MVGVPYLMVSLQPTSSQGLTGNDSTCIKSGILGSFRSGPLKMDTLVDKDIECQYEIIKGSIKGLKNEKAK